MRVRVDWSKRADYIETRHGVDPDQASEAVNDDHAVWLVPDPASRSGNSVRVIGYSPGASSVLAVILVRADASPDEPPDGDWWGSTAWHANIRDLRINHQWGGNTMSKIEELLAAEGAAAENNELPDRLPENVTTSRPGLGRDSVVSVRLSADEHRQLQQAAVVAGLPVSTLMRVWALDRLRSEREDATGSVAERLSRLEQEVFQRSA